MKCETCGTMDPFNVIRSRGYWWHRECAVIIGDEVDFPSGGKLIPDRIVTGLILEPEKREGTC